MSAAKQDSESIKKTKEASAKKKLKTILVSQPKPENDRNPYYDLADRLKLNIDFRPFIHVEGISAQEFRNQRVSILSHTAVIFTSRTAVDHYFRMASEMRLTIPDTMKYFCMSESTAFYLQRYVVYRKRKIFHGRQTFGDVIEVMKKHKDDKFLLPSSDILKPIIPKLLVDNRFQYSRAILYNTVCSDLSDLQEVFYDILVFFSPSGIKSLYENFPDFEQKDTKIAVYGPTTKKAAKDAGLRIDLLAPSKEYPSMTMALEAFIKKQNKK